MKFRFQYIYFAFLLSFIILTVLSVLFYKRLMTSNQWANKVEHSYAVLYTLSEVDSHLKDAIGSERGFILTRDSSLLEPYLANSARIQPLLDSLRILAGNATREQRYIYQLKKVVSDRLLQIRVNINKAALEHESDLDLRLLQTKALMDDYYLVTSQLIQEQQLALDQANRQKENYQRNTPNLLFALFLFAAITFVVSFFFINRELRKRVLFQQQLQQQVGELNRANTELEQLTHTTSHHLQEPLRKIRTFTNQLMTRYKEKLPEDMNFLLTKIDASAEHMHGLTADMSNYSNLINTDERPVDVDLNYILLKVSEKMDEPLTLAQASLRITNNLPVIKGIPIQLALLFEQLIDNSLKFSRKDVPPQITITNEEVIGRKISDKILAVFGKTLYHRISIADNGMGFNNEFAEKIFELFQKLDSTRFPYQSKGIGLAMVQRIMVNHGGNVTATGIAGNGAVFYLYFPVPNR
ncbi:MAG: CHASE3 domain-containing protein [Candidatus Pseudobacter hemicellulosilyticus]|uniref:histidine kinase n=1 Tax=Candidatus Pseudobacter hemicellulosilyticus TaxID=3121375 RepID=A0AAJ5WPN5_9BACT|nr:MAG: CHASE3 domain-containing protein [Pseudobacter sp.]